MRSIFFALAIPLGATACTRGADDDAAGLARRASALKLFALPRLGDPNVPAAVFVHSRVPSILVATARPGILLKINGQVAGSTPLEVPTRVFTHERANDPSAPFPVEFYKNANDMSRPLRPARFALRFEAANLNIHVPQNEIPEELLKRDLWFFVQFDDPK